MWGEEDLRGCVDHDFGGALLGELLHGGKVRVVGW